MNARLPRFSCLGGTFSLCVFSAATLLTIQPQARAQTPVLQYNFNGATGANTGSAGTGTLTANGTASFAGTGVSGAAGDNALSLTNAYTGGTGAGNSASNTSGLNVGMLSQFTVTMWIKTTSADLASTAFPRLFQLGTATSPDNTNPGLTLLLGGGNTIQYDVNAGNNGTAHTTAALSGLSNNVGQWVFVALVYDGTSTTPYNSGPMNTNFGSYNNSALLLGTTASSVSVVDSYGTYAATTANSAGPIALGTAATAYLGNRMDGGRGFTGSIDDVRLYSSILTTSQIDAIRTSDIGAVPEPSTVVVPLACLGVLAFSVYRRKAARV